MGISTVVKEHDEESSNNDTSRESEVKEESNEESSSDQDDEKTNMDAPPLERQLSGSGGFSFVRKPTLYESIRGSN